MPHVLSVSKLELFVLPCISARKFGNVILQDIGYIFLKSDPIMLEQEFEGHISGNSLRYSFLKQQTLKSIASIHQKSQLNINSCHKDKNILLTQCLAAASGCQQKPMLKKLEQKTTTKMSKHQKFTKNYISTFENSIVLGQIVLHRNSLRTNPVADINLNKILNH